MFTYSTVYPLNDALQTMPGWRDTLSPEKIVKDCSDYYWYIISRIPPVVLSNYKNGLLVKLSIMGAGLFIVIIFASWFLATAIIRRRIYQSELVEMATRDALTNLPNRRMGYEQLKSAVLQAGRYSKKLSLLYIDLDDFKEVNDSRGHEAGDELLIKVSEILTSVSRSSDVIARLGGDEFICILPEVDSTESASLVGRKMIEALSTPIQLSFGDVTIGASIGSAVFPVHGDNYATLLRNADIAMYASKTAGKNICSVYEL